MKRFVYARMRCKTCHGFGVVMGKDGETKPCWACDGSGTVEI